MSITQVSTIGACVVVALGLNLISVLPDSYFEVTLVMAVGALFALMKLFHCRRSGGGLSPRSLAC